MRKVEGGCSNSMRGTLCFCHNNIHIPQSAARHELPRQAARTNGSPHTCRLWHRRRYPFYETTAPEHAMPLNCPVAWSYANSWSPGQVLTSCGTANLDGEKIAKEKMAAATAPVAMTVKTQPAKMPVARGGVVGGQSARQHRKSHRHHQHTWGCTVHQGGTNRKTEKRVNIGNRYDDPV